MRKNQKYTQEEMYLAIEMWKESGLSSQKFCKREKLAVGTFKYWQLKYNKEQKQLRPPSAQSFIPIEVCPTVDKPVQPTTLAGSITITYPSGTEVNCPKDIGLEQLKTLIRL